MGSETKKTKLTLTVRKDIIEKAKQKAKEKGVSLSQLFEESMTSQESNDQKKKITKLDELRALIMESKPSKVLPETDRALYHKRLEKKYG